MLRRLLPGDFLGDPFDAARNVVLGAVLETNIGGVRTAGLITEAGATRPRTPTATGARSA